jgi:hypothetical protein
MDSFGNIWLAMTLLMIIFTNKFNVLKVIFVFLCTVTIIKLVTALDF